MFNSVRSNENLNKAAKQLYEIGHATAFQYLPSAGARMAFLQEISTLVNGVTREVSINCMSLNCAVETLNEEAAHLRQQQFQLMTGRMVQYAAIKKERIGRAVNLLVKQVGFIGGGTQVFAGFGVCAASVGMACATFGTPLIAQGANNFYENGYYLLFRKEKAGYLREGYRSVARHLGYSDKDADLAYATVDLSLSIYGMSRLVLKPDTFRLFRHINTDNIRGWRDMGRVSLGLEGMADGITLYSIHQLSRENE
ncbi:DUF4225 domain-containing protein [Erwinia tracheiphila]|uniref:DUF4225 domain-containing protein n=1 Tax=Erwinia tracheiphila TaxID=65700 RepID=A0A345CUH6_9GAMM|nr:DUF4225 domain-containing protein [Erwinia tracheiphila]AXF77093.1 DUF4225 domain-containing protein [Erwinia tracheiphila]UIA84223.1 DUF4225 domain-containing protein [Erwinia tracheiphila]UIA92803.1 DUF4225 domain-containing protein [Erwinia tracheiphila]